MLVIIIKFNIKDLSLHKKIIDMKKILLMIILLLPYFLIAQQNENYFSDDIFVIDSFITPEKPHKLYLSFSTNDSCKSNVKINKHKNYVVSNEFTDLHKIEIELNDNDLIAEVITYQITLTFKNNKTITSENYFVELPQELSVKHETSFNYTQMCIGALVFAIPTLNYSFINGKEFLGLSKELPLYNFYNRGYNYPEGYISFEYTHYLKAENKNIIRFGYKYIFQMGQIKYISPGITYLTNLKGFNGISIESSVGLFQIKNVFTTFVKYRYNLLPNKSSNNFYEFSIGLYSNFFSLNF